MTSTTMYEGRNSELSRVGEAIGAVGDDATGVADGPVAADLSLL